jgi:hypothetical protein
MLNAKKRTFGLKMRCLREAPHGEAHIFGLPQNLGKFAHRFPPIFHFQKLRNENKIVLRVLNRINRTLRWTMHRPPEGPSHGRYIVHRRVLMRVMRTPPGTPLPPEFEEL